jgi:hypothetical protein
MADNMKDLGQMLGGSIETPDDPTPGAGDPSSPPPDSEELGPDTGSSIDPGTGFPNPLRLVLTACHLPSEMCQDPRQATKYVMLYHQMNEVAKVVPSTAERVLYGKFQKLAPMPNLSIRYFAAAIRLISAGRPLVSPNRQSLDELAL